MSSFGELKMCPDTKSFLDFYESFKHIYIALCFSVSFTKSPPPRGGKRGKTSGDPSISVKC